MMAIGVFLFMDRQENFLDNYVMSRTTIPYIPKLSIRDDPTVDLAQSI